MFPFFKAQSRHQVRASPSAAAASKTRETSSTAPSTFKQEPASDYYADRVEASRISNWESTTTTDWSINTGSLSKINSQDNKYSDEKSDVDLDGATIDRNNNNRFHPVSDSGFDDEDLGDYAEDRFEEYDDNSVEDLRDSLEVDRSEAKEDSMAVDNLLEKTGNLSMMDTKEGTEDAKPTAIASTDEDGNTVFTSTSAVAIDQEIAVSLAF